MSGYIVHVVGTGTIGEPLIGLLCDFKEKLGISQVSFSKRQALLTDRSKVKALMKRGAAFCAERDTMASFHEIGVQPDLSVEDAFEQADVIIDCTPVGNQNKVQKYEALMSNTKGFIAQGSEFGFGKMYARGINDSALTADDKFIQVVSCNTHNLSVLLKNIALHAEDPENLRSAHFVCIRRANDISQDGSFIPAHEVNRHSDPNFGTHHARDAHELFKTLNMNLNVYSSALKTNSQYMHTLWFQMELRDKTSKDELIQRFKQNDRIALTQKNTSNSVFSFGRDHGHFGRILNQTVVLESALEVVNGTNVVGWCFTPQDGNSLLSSLSAACYLLHPKEYEERIQCLKPYFFDEV